MKSYPLVTKYIFVLVAALLLSGCGSAPSIRDSKRIDNAAARTDRLSFIYRQSEMKTVSSFGRGSASDGETGYSDFGKFLVSQAPTAFQSYGVRVTASRLVEGNAPIDTKIETASGETGTDHVLLLFATSGQVSANRHATRISFVFDAHLVNIRSKKMVWKASIDTSTWSGRDFVQKGFEKTMYDEKYAQQLLQKVAEKMKDDGVI